MKRTIFIISLLYLASCNEAKPIINCDNESTFDALVNIHGIYSSKCTFYIRMANETNKSVYIDSANMAYYTCLAITEEAKKFKLK